jgi:hypothetical protein
VCTGNAGVVARSQIFHEHGSVACQRYAMTVPFQRDEADDCNWLQPLASLSELRASSLKTADSIDFL